MGRDITDTEALRAESESAHDRDIVAKPEGKVQRQTYADNLETVDTSRAASPVDTDTDFDWNETDTSDEEEKEATKHAKEEELVDRHRHNIKRARRLRKVYLACMRVSRPVRTVLIAILGGGLLIIPALVIWTSDRGNVSISNSSVRANIKIWSLWLSIVWMSACGTSIFVDAIPWIIKETSVLLTGLYPQAIKSKVARRPEMLG